MSHEIKAVSERVKQGVNWGLAIWLSIVLVGTVALRLPSFFQPIDCDEAAYAYCGHRILAGARVYEDVWENKPPLAYLLFSASEALVGFGPFAVRLVGLLAAGVVVGGMFWHASHLYGTKKAIGVGVIAMISTMDVYTLGFSANLEIFVNAAVILAICFWHQSSSSRLSTKSPRPGLFSGLLAGCCLGFASLVKQPALAFFLLFLVPPPRSIDFPRATRLFVALTGVILPWIVVGLWLEYQGLLNVALWACAAYPLEMTRHLAQGLPESSWLDTLRFIARGSEASPWWGWGLLPTIVLAMGVTVMRVVDRQKVSMGVPFYGTWFVLALILVMIQRQGWQHYYQLLVPPLCLLAICFPYHTRFQRLLMAFYLSLIFTNYSYHWLVLGKTDRCQQVEGFDQWLALEDIGENLRRQFDQWAPDPGERTMFVWGWQTPLYVSTQTTSPTAFFMADPLLADGVRRLPHPWASERYTRITDDLYRSPPRLIMVGLRPFPGLQSLLRDQYVMIVALDHDPQGMPRGIYLRRDLANK